MLAVDQITAATVHVNKMPSLWFFGVLVQLACSDHYSPGHIARIGTPGARYWADADRTLGKRGSFPGSVRMLAITSHCQRGGSRRERTLPCSHRKRRSTRTQTARVA